MTEQITRGTDFRARPNSRHHRSWMLSSARLAILPMGFLAAVLPQASYAQANAPTSTSEASPSYDIIVTARKRDESLLDVPVAITALTAESIGQRNITSLQDVAQFTPSLKINDLAANQATRNNQQIIMRGMFTQSSQGVSVFIDGAPVAGGFVSNISDAQRVEVLKGPQTAYFGRQTFSGAVNIVTKDPGDKLGGTFSALAGTDDWRDLSASIEGPITNWLSGRVMVRDWKKGGQYDNSVDGGTLGTQGTQSVAVNLKATPSSSLTMKFYGTYWQDRDGPAAVGKLTSRDFNCNAGGAPAGTNNFICGTLPILPNGRVGAVTALSPQFLSNVLYSNSTALNPLFGSLISTPGFGRNAGHAHFNIDYTPEGLGGITFASLTGYNESRTMALSQLDNQDTRDIPNPLAFIPGTVSYTLWQTRVQSKSRDFSQEFRVASDPEDRLHWLLGVNYAKARGQSYVDGFFTYGAGTFGSGGHSETETKGVFFSVGFDITDKLSINAEGRYQSDKVSTFSRSRTAEPSVIASAKNTNFMPRVSLQYHATKDVMLYASYAEGVNPPAFNTGLIGLPQAAVDSFASIYGATLAVSPEYNEDYEIGVKGMFFDRRLQLSLGGYYTNWTNQIRSVFAVIPGIAGFNGGQPYSSNVSTNAGRTELWGIETDGLIVINKDLTVDFSTAYNPSKIKEYPNFVCPASACVGGNATTDVVGNSLPYGAQFAGNVGVTYKGDLSAKVNYYVRAENVYTGKRYIDATNLTSIGASNIVNGRVGIGWDNIKIDAFVENLFNMRQYAGYLGGTDIDASPNAAGVYPAAFQVVMPALRRAGVKLSIAL